MTDINPAAVMAEHSERTRYITGGHSLGFGSPTHYCNRCRNPWPCLPYRLAAEVVSLREQVRAKQAEAWEAGFRARAEAVRFSEGPYAAVLAPTAEPEPTHDPFPAHDGRCINHRHAVTSACPIAPTAEEAKPEVRPACPLPGHSGHKYGVCR